MTREEAAHIVDVAFGVPQAVRRIGEDKTYHEDEIREAKDMAIKALEQELCEDEYIKVPKKALKYRTAGMIAYNAEWLKNHFDMERAVICGEQEPKTGHWIEKDGFDGDTYYDCSECGESWTTIEGTPWDNEFKYCPNCGCRMVEPQERSEKE